MSTGLVITIIVVLICCFCCLCLLLGGAFKVKTDIDGCVGEDNITECSKTDVSTTAEGFMIDLDYNGSDIEEKFILDIRGKMTKRGDTDPTIASFVDRASIPDEFGGGFGYGNRHE